MRAECAGIELAEMSARIDRKRAFINFTARNLLWAGLVCQLLGLGFDAEKKWRVEAVKN